QQGELARGKTESALVVLQSSAEVIALKLKTAGRRFGFDSASKRAGGSCGCARINLGQRSFVDGAVSQDRLQYGSCIGGVRGGRRHLQIRRGRIRTFLRSYRNITANDMVNDRFGNAHRTGRRLEGYFAILPDRVGGLNLAPILEVNRIRASEKRAQAS